MATSSTNLNLTLPVGGERLSLAILNENWNKIDQFAGNANCAVITNQYSSVLDAINAFRTSKTFPFTIQKAGSSAYTDLPSELSSTCEWNVVCTGDKERITAVLTVYTGGSSRNGWSWTSNIYNGSYILNWTSVNSQLGGTKIFAVSKTVTVPAGDSTTPGQVTVDFSSDIGSASIWLAFASLGSSVLPYVSNAGAVKTWIRTVSGSPTQQVTIYNTDSAWSNYTAYFVLICK